MREKEKLVGPDRDEFLDVLKDWRVTNIVVWEIDGQEIYVEMRFDQRKPDWPKIRIVHLHPPGKHFPIPRDSK